MINIEGLTKTFDGYNAVDGVTCSIQDGCIYGMVGSNGSGKSTFLRLIAGIYKPDKGNVYIDGIPVYEHPEVKNKLAFVPDDLYFVNNSSMKRMAGFYNCVYSNFDMDRFCSLSEMFKLDINKSVSTFSKGMKRQAAIILAVSSHPQYLLLDETFDGLDPVMRNLVKNTVCQDVEDNNMTVIMTSHSLRELEDTCDQLALLHKGGLVLESDILDLKTSLFKIQIAFVEKYDRSMFDGFDILHFSKHGSVSNIIMRGDKEAVAEHLKAMKPAILDILPLTLEEVFTYEMETLGYVFNPEIFEKEDRA